MARHHRGRPRGLGRELRGHAAAAADGRAPVGLGAPRPAGRSRPPRRGPRTPPGRLVVALRGARHAQRRRLLPARVRRGTAAPVEHRRLGDGAGAADHGRLRLAARGRADDGPGPGRRGCRHRRGAAARRRRQRQHRPDGGGGFSGRPPALLGGRRAGQALERRHSAGRADRLAARLRWRDPRGRRAGRRRCPAGPRCEADGRFRVHHTGRDRARLPLLVRRAGPAAGGHRRRGRAAQPGDRRAPRRSGGPRDVHPGAGRPASCWY